MQQRSTERSIGGEAQTCCYLDTGCQHHGAHLTYARRVCIFNEGHCLDLRDHVLKPRRAHADVQVSRPVAIRDKVCGRSSYWDIPDCFLDRGLRRYAGWLLRRIVRTLPK